MNKVDKETKIASNAFKTKYKNEISAYSNPDEGICKSITLINKRISVAQRIGSSLDKNNIQRLVGKQNFKRNIERNLYNDSSKRSIHLMIPTSEKVRFSSCQNPFYTFISFICDLIFEINEMCSFLMYDITKFFLNS